MSKMADAARDWLLANSPSAPVKSEELWKGLLRDRPDVAAATEKRKTPRNTLMRDMRLDKQSRFIVGKGLVRLAKEGDT